MCELSRWGVGLRAQVPPPWTVSRTKGMLAPELLQVQVLIRRLLLALQAFCERDALRHRLPCFGVAPPLSLALALFLCLHRVMNFLS